MAVPTPQLLCHVNGEGTGGGRRLGVVTAAGTATGTGTETATVTTHAMVTEDAESLPWR